ncbi:MAG TPA: glycoside hydrolase family 2 TIM barrel-domain containing protein [Bacteroidales bacterium]|mgnify:CR=1 FL=1|nr:glycoside hydrolase family 2 TIM barrel-domain containing protein [Bacteroidales bacterium]HQG56506.1 glycoside hydrolase family 2 TIM barrel-domain containing protein [Bacteroidales bacterium]HQK69636.1 glycoside hydrolase family 2 TIM barrel-domain containing protein [Bacteroidales bacterium]
MKRISFFYLFFISGFLLVFQTEAQQVPRVVMAFNEGWRFYLGDTANAFMTGFDDSNWRMLDLPHDWSIEGRVDQKAPSGGAGGYFPTGIGWYRKHFIVRKNELGMNHVILFDGVYMNSDVWLNGKHLGHYPFGYNSFYYSLDPYLKEGENIIAVRVDNSLQPNSRWYSGSGIYRKVWLIRRNYLHVRQWGVYITTPEVSDKEATVAVKTEIENAYALSRKAIVSSVILNKNGIAEGTAETVVELAPGENTDIKQVISVESPELWSIETPVLYTLVTRIIVNGKPVDEVRTPFGIREIIYDTDKGFFLNGKNVKMNGVCLHHDAGCLGAAVPVRVWERRLKILKEMGCNAIRTSHNPVAPEFLDLCDRMGFLVMDEIFDEWKRGKVTYGYNKYFDEWAERDLISFIRRDRNHPSVVMWSAGNEIREQPVEGGEKVLKWILDIFHSEDPTRPVTVGCDNIAADDNPARVEFLNLLDIVGYNYVDRWHERRELFYSIDRHIHPEWKMVGTESVSVGGIRGDYSFGKDTSVLNPNYNTRMIRAEQLWKFVRMNSYVIGDFMWTGIDYLGESFWPSKNASSGVIDLCGFPKDGYYFYKSQWTTTPFIHIFPHWNWQGMEGKVIPVMAYTNCDAVELIVNGRSYGEKRLEFPRQGASGRWNSYERPQVFPTTADLHLSWDVPYQPGKIVAVGKKGGKIVCTEVIETTGPPAALRLTCDRNTINADNEDVVHVKVEAIDSQGRVVPTASNMIYYSVSGAGKLIGLENGNPVDHEPYKSNRRSLFNGLGLAIIQAGKEPGKIIIKASSDGMKDVSIEVNVVKPLK